MVTAVVKADAYGHGAVMLSKVFLQNGADRLAVSSLDEGTELRRAKITAPILILGHTAGERAEELLDNDIEPAVFSYRDAEMFSRKAVETGREVKIHVSYRVCPFSRSDRRSQENCRFAGNCYARDFYTL